MNGTDTPECRSRIALAMLIATPLLVITMLGTALALMSPRGSSGDQPPADPRPFNSSDIARNAPAQAPSMPMARPDLEGYSIYSIAQANASQTALVFSNTEHAVLLEESSVDVMSTVIAAAETTAVGWYGEALLVRPEGSELSTEHAKLTQWWWPDHPAVVHDSGATFCFECHDETFCSW